MFTQGIQIDSCEHTYQSCHISCLNVRNGIVIQNVDALILYHDCWSFQHVCESWNTQIDFIQRAHWSHYKTLYNSNRVLRQLSHSKTPACYTLILLKCSLSISEHMSSNLPLIFQLQVPFEQSVCQGCCCLASPTIQSGVFSSSDVESYTDIEVSLKRFNSAFKRCVSFLAAALALLKLHCPKGSHPFLSPCCRIDFFLILEWQLHPYIRTTDITTSPNLFFCLIWNSKGRYFFLQTGIPMFL